MFLKFFMASSVWRPHTASICRREIFNKEAERLWIFFWVQFGGNNQELKEWGDHPGMIEIQERAVQCCNVEAIWVVLQPERMLIMHLQSGDKKGILKKIRVKNSFLDDMMTFEVTTQSRQPMSSFSTYKARWANLMGRVQKEAAGGITWGLTLNWASATHSNAILFYLRKGYYVVTSSGLFESGVSAIANNF